MAFLVGEYNLLRDVALHNFVSEVPSHRVATESVDLKALLQREATGLKTNVHKPGAREVKMYSPLKIDCRQMDGVVFFCDQNNSPIFTDVMKTRSA